MSRQRCLYCGRWTMRLFRTCVVHAEREPTLPIPSNEGSAEKRVIDRSIADRYFESITAMQREDSLATPASIDATEGETP